MARILFILVLLLALPANALTWFDCGYAWSAELIQPSPPACFGPTNPDGSCRSYDVTWSDEIGGGNPIVVVQRFCTHQSCAHVPCRPIDDILPNEAANVEITGQTGAWFCMYVPATPSVETPHIMARCHS